MRGDALAKPEISNDDATANAADTFLGVQSFISNRGLAFSLNPAQLRVLVPFAIVRNRSSADEEN